MSFSFNVRAATKDEAAIQAKAKMDEVVVQQPVHAHDAGHVIATVEDYLTLLPEDLTQDVTLSVSGWVSAKEWTSPEASLASIYGCSVSVSVQIAPKL